MQIISVSEFINLVNETLSFAYTRVVVEGEVSGYQVRQGKWVFFDLKDAETSVNCFATTFQLKTPIEDGMKIRVTATPKLTKWGKFSLTVHDIELAGEGALKRAFELLKAKLEKEGLFSPERKRALPKFPRTIGLITSLDSAAYRDFIEILNNRWGGVHVMAADVRVQGESAPGEIVEAINYFNQLAQPVDVLVITRGGGSLEDLQAFSTEPVTRAVAGSRVPTIVGVGHEVDVSLADLAADTRAATPTDAARLAVPDKQEFKRFLSFQQQTMHSALTRQRENASTQLHHHVQALERFVLLPKERVVTSWRILQQQFRRVGDRLERYDQRVGQLRYALDRQQHWQLNESKRSLLSLVRTLKNLDPEQVLKRGYAITRLGDKIIRYASEVSKGDKLMIQLAKGKLKTEVKDVESQ